MNVGSNFIKIATWAKGNISAGLRAARKKPQLFTFEREGCYQEGSRGAGLQLWHLGDAWGRAQAARPRFRPPLSGNCCVMVGGLSNLSAFHAIWRTRLYPSHCVAARIPPNKVT